MSRDIPDFAPALSQSPSGKIAMLRLAALQAGQLRQAYHCVLMQRDDSLAWLRLESSVADLLERQRVRIVDGDPRTRAAASQLSEADLKLERRVAAMLRRADRTVDLGGAYRIACEEMRGNAAHWHLPLNDAERSYWCHAALVWMSLWHAAEAPAADAGQMAIYLEEERNPSAASSVRRHPVAAPAAWISCFILGAAFWLLVLRMLL